MRIISGSARGRRLHPPRDMSTRPALDRIREAVFGILGDTVEGTRVLDLYAGVGAFGLEALSRGARHATFVDQSVTTLAILERNITELSFQRQTTVLCADALTAPDLGRSTGVFGLVFLDPPFQVFRDTHATQAVFERTAELLGSPAVSSQANIVLRLPSAFRDPLPFDAVERHYGQSRVAFLRRA